MKNFSQPKKFLGSVSGLKFNYLVNYSANILKFLQII